MYGDELEEYFHLVEHAGLIDIAAERCIEITGRDAHRFTNLLTPRNLDRCAIGQAKYGILTDERGGIVADPVFLRLGEDRYWLSVGDADALLWVRGVATGASMDVDVREADAWQLQLIGPKASHVLGELMDLSAFDNTWMTETMLDGIPVVLVLSGDNWSKPAWTGSGYAVYLRDPARGEELWDRLIEAGKPHRLRPIGPSERWRIEAGIYAYGADFTTADNPFEVTGLEDFVEEQDGEYIGKGALARIQQEGVARRLVGIEIDGSALTAGFERWPVSFHGRRAGVVTSAVFVPRLERNVGFAWVPASAAVPGTPIDLGAPVNRHASVVPLPFRYPDATGD
jgi:aminomethyltransferase